MEAYAQGCDYVVDLICIDKVKCTFEGFLTTINFNVLCLLNVWIGVKLGIFLKYVLYLSTFRSKSY